MMARIEARQVPDRQGFDGLTLAQLMERMRVPGVSIAVIKDFEIHWAKGYGIADVTTGAPVTPDTIFQAASISKPTAAMGVMRAGPGRRMSLDADVNTYSEVVEAARERAHARPPGNAALAAQPHLGPRRRLRVPGLSPAAPLPTLVQILERREALEHRQGPDGAAAVHRLQVLRRRRHAWCSSR